MKMIHSNRIRFSVLLLLALLTGSCAPTTDKPAAPVTEVSKEKALRSEIVKLFPGAVTFDRYADSLLFFLYAVHKIQPQKILLGQSTCVDDVLNTKSPFDEQLIKGPFNFGGLGGLPFTGISGMNAYSHHVPDSGAALLLVGPHIGYSEKNGWGWLHREGQAETSTCCGALVGALNKLQKPGEIVRKAPSEPDYQEQVIEQLALRHKSEILESKVPLVSLTKLVHEEVAKVMSTLPREDAHYRYIILITAVIINTDHSYPDYIWVDQMSIFDLETDTYLKIMEK